MGKVSLEIEYNKVGKDKKNYQFKDKVSGKLIGLVSTNVSVDVQEVAEKIVNFLEEPKIQIVSVFGINTKKLVQKLMISGNVYSNDENMIVLIADKDLRYYYKK